MKELIAVILLLMIFSSARGETPAYFNTEARDTQLCYYVNPDGGERYHTQRDCPSISAKYHDSMVEVRGVQLENEYANLLPCSLCGADKAAEPGQAVAYVVGQDLQEGMYTFIAEEGCQGTLIITNWDGSISYQSAVEPGWVDTLRIYNEQTVILPAGCRAEFSMQFAASAYDTGSRQLYATVPDVYGAGKEIKAGLYIVQNENTPSAAVRVRDEGGSVIREWNLMPDSYYTIHLKDGWSVEIDEGCLLRSMTTKYIFQEGTSAVVPGSRYITGMQIPCRSYTFTGRDWSSRVNILNLATGEETLTSLSAGETFNLEAGEELLVEMINVDVSWEQGIG